MISEDSVLLTLGDSITAGTWLPNPEEDAWPNRIHPGMTVVNKAYGGSCLLFWDSYTPPLTDLGPSIAAQVEATHVVISIGRNDMMNVSPHNTDPRDVVLPMVEGYSRLNERLGALGCEVWWTTVTPQREASPWCDQLDWRRRVWNYWLGYYCHNLINWEGYLRQGSDLWMRNDLSVDDLHPNVQGHGVLASRFDEVWGATHDGQ